MSKHYKPNNSTILYLNSSYNCVKSSSITLAKTTGGSGYSTAPIITISSAPGDMGSGASATCAISGGAITTITMVSNGQNYNTLPIITIGGTLGVITGTSSLVGGSSYAQAPTITATGGSGSGFTAYSTLNPTTISSSPTITAGGTGYISGDLVNFSGGGGSGAVATVIAAAGIITGFTFTNNGTGYTTPPTITIGGSGAVIVAALNGAAISSTFTITSGGTGYITGDKLVFTGGGSPTTVAVATVTATSGVITAVSLTTVGAGYTLVPNVTIGGSGAVIVANLTATSVASLTVTNGGTGYTSAPTIVFTPVQGGSGASATANVISTAAILTPSFLRTFTWIWNVPDIIINDLAKLSAINVVATGFTSTTPYTYRINGLQYDSRDSYFSDYGAPILSIAQNVNICSYGSLGGTDFSIILTQQVIKQISISVDDDITNKGSGQLSTINFIIAMEIQEYDPVITQIGDPFGESYSKYLKSNN